MYIVNIMRKNILSVLVATAFITTGYAQNKTAMINIKTTINCDHCKQCESCGSRLENALYAQKGVKRVDIDDKKMEIKVVYNSEKLTALAIKETIAANGYDADDIKAAPEAIAKLDDCCKGE